MVRVFNYLTDQLHTVPATPFAKSADLGVECTSSIVGIEVQAILEIRF